MPPITQLKYILVVAYFIGNKQSAKYKNTIADKRTDADTNNI